MPTAAVQQESPTHAMIRRATIALDNLKEGFLSSVNSQRLSDFADALLSCEQGTGYPELRTAIGRVWLRATESNGTITEWYERYIAAAQALKHLLRSDQPAEVPDELYNLIAILL